MSAIFGSPQQQYQPQQGVSSYLPSFVQGQGSVPIQMQPRTCMQNEQPSCVKPSIFSGIIGGKHKKRRQRGGFDPYDPAAQPQALVGGRRRKSKSTRRKTGGKRKGTKSRRTKKTRTHKRR